MIFTLIKRLFYAFCFSISITFCADDSGSFVEQGKSRAGVDSKDQKTFIILVHGTFASNSVWHNHKGPFFLELKKYCDTKNMDFAIESHIWSGTLSVNGRLQGAIGLAKRIMEIKQGCPNSKIICIGHSHGGNVILMASQMLFISKTAVNLIDCDISRSVVWSLIAQDLFYPNVSQEEGFRSIQTDSDPMIETINTFSEIEMAAQMIKEFLTRGATLAKEAYKIDQAYLLATPINPKIYAPCSDSVCEVYSLYSEMDMIQTYTPAYKHRFIEYGELSQYLPTKIFEFRIELYNSQTDKIAHQPGHLEMNDAWVGAGLLSLPTSATITSVVMDKKDQTQFLVKFFKDGVSMPKVFLL